MPTIATKVKVVARFRPTNAIEEEIDEHDMLDIDLEPEFVQLGHKGQAWTFSFDRIFGPESSQRDVFEELKPTLSDILSGFNGTIFAYGQTGSGKTHSMFGPPNYKEDPEQGGLVIRMCMALFEHVQMHKDNVEWKVSGSYLQVYKERVQDLLDPSKDNLEIRESPTSGIFVEGLTSRDLTCIEDVSRLLAKGDHNRVKCGTAMNAESSRSHCLFSVTLTKIMPNGDTTKGELKLVDLAGSEKVAKSKVQGLALEQAAKINASLSALGNCIFALSSGQSFIPYRNSKLTRILQESLGGNTKTTLIVCCSPHGHNLDETLSTLRFASRAKFIKTSVNANFQPSGASLSQQLSDLQHGFLTVQLFAKSLEQTIGWMKTNDDPSAPNPYEVAAPACYKPDEAELELQRLLQEEEAAATCASPGRRGPYRDPAARRKSVFGLGLSSPHRGHRLTLGAPHGPATSRARHAPRLSPLADTWGSRAVKALLATPSNAALSPTTPHMPALKPKMVLSPGGAGDAEGDADGWGARVELQEAGASSIMARRQHKDMSAGLAFGSAGNSDDEAISSEICEVEETLSELQEALELPPRRDERAGDLQASSRNSEGPDAPDSAKSSEKHEDACRGFGPCRPRSRRASETPGSTTSEDGESRSRRMSTSSWGCRTGCPAEGLALEVAALKWKLAVAEQTAAAAKDGERGAVDGWLSQSVDRVSPGSSGGQLDSNGSRRGSITLRHPTISGRRRSLSVKNLPGIPDHDHLRAAREEALNALWARAKHADTVRADLADAVGDAIRSAVSAVAEQEAEIHYLRCAITEHESRVATLESLLAAQTGAVQSDSAENKPDSSSLVSPELFDRLEAMETRVRWVSELAGGFAKGQQQLGARGEQVAEQLVVLRGAWQEASSTVRERCDNVYESLSALTTRVETCELEARTTSETAESLVAATAATQQEVAAALLEAKTAAEGRDVQVFADQLRAQLRTKAVAIEAHVRRLQTAARRDEPGPVQDLQDRIEDVTSQLEAAEATIAELEDAKRAAEAEVLRHKETQALLHQQLKDSQSACASEQQTAEHERARRRELGREVERIKEELEGEREAVQMLEEQTDLLLAQREELEEQAVAAETRVAELESKRHQDSSHSEARLRQVSTRVMELRDMVLRMKGQGSSGDF